MTTSFVFKLLLWHLVNVFTALHSGKWNLLGTINYWSLTLQYRHSKGLEHQHCQLSKWLYKRMVVIIKSLMVRWAGRSSAASGSSSRGTIVLLFKGAKWKSANNKVPISCVHASSSVASPFPHVTLDELRKEDVERHFWAQLSESCSTLSVKASSKRPRKWTKNYFKKLHLKVH